MVGPEQIIVKWISETIPRYELSLVVWWLTVTFETLCHILEREQEEVYLGLSIWKGGVAIFWEEKQQDKQVESVKSRAWYLDILNLRCFFRHSNGSIQLAVWGFWEKSKLQIKNFKTLSYLALLTSKKKCWKHRESANFQAIHIR